MAGNWAGSGTLGRAITHRRFLGALPAGAAGIALTGTLDCEPTSHTLASAAPGGPGQARAFRTRPDLRSPDIKVNAGSPAAMPGYVFVSTLQAEGPCFAVKGEDDSGQKLATSLAVRPQDRASIPPNQERGQES